MSHKNVTEVVWHILGQLSSLQASGHWQLVSCHCQLVSGSASSKKPKIRPCFVKYLRDITLVND